MIAAPSRSFASGNCAGAHRLAADAHVVATLLTVGDGVALIRWA